MLRRCWLGDRKETWPVRCIRRNAMAKARDPSGNSVRFLRKSQWAPSPARDLGEYYKLLSGDFGSFWLYPSYSRICQRLQYSGWPVMTLSIAHFSDVWKTFHPWEFLYSPSIVPWGPWCLCFPIQGRTHRRISQQSIHSLFNSLLTKRMKERTNNADDHIPSFLN